MELVYNMYVHIMGIIMETTKRKKGFQPKYEDMNKEHTFNFRCSSFEKAILTEIMKPDQWRDFCVLLSMYYLGLDKTRDERKIFDYAKRRENLFGVNIKGLLDSVKTKET